MTILNETHALAVRGWTARRYGLMVGVVLSAVGGRYHIAVGTQMVMGPVYEAALPPKVAAILEVMWWQMAALIIGGGVAMAVAAFKVEWRRPLAWLVGGHYLVIAVICLAISIVWFGSPLGLFQWMIFGSLGLLLVWAGWGQTARNTGGAC
ncbi:hypothetical protein [Devosia lacusdianchii]|uniref:hypothetical protein n=1 Tax=Devosia lacusdianchii TaxID=2917991 RepID=UPI001F05C078|nr:hypothetical protein [Devosia sp. JXJ CY 41]